jgi:hypothetical protein
MCFAELAEVRLLRRGKGQLEPIKHSSTQPNIRSKWRKFNAFGSPQTRPKPNSGFRPGPSKLHASSDLYQVIRCFLLPWDAQAERSEELGFRGEQARIKPEGTRLIPDEQTIRFVGWVQQNVELFGNYN